ncbi:elongation factor P [Alphaproteobacteria bacterium]|nr:elongation factor P [Alphaproteobacteria bacterium]
MKIDGNQIKIGNILEINNKLWRVTKTQHTQPGKGGAYLQVEMKELKDGTKTNERFRSSESVERAILDEKICQFLYSEDNKFYFMDNINFEQIEIGSDIITSDQSKFLKENDNITVQLYESQPVSIILPDHVNFKVIEADAVVKGQTAASSYKPAVLERKIRTSVPPFIEIGDEIVINTNDSSYVEKFKK